MTACPDRLLHLHALVDGELDAANALSVEAHAATCPGCTEELRMVRALRAELSAGDAAFTAPAGLRGRIENLLDAEAPSAAPPAARRRAPQGRRIVGGRTLTGALVAMAAAVTVIFAAPQFMTDGLQDQLVSSHVRSLLAAHLVDVQTSDRHVVKPWFNGRTDVSPPVVELRDQGFPLVGGRLDYIEGRVVPALVYRRHLHTINLFVRPAGRVPVVVQTVHRRGGYNLVHWTRDGLDFWAVSDVETGDLQAFRRAFVERSAG